MKTPTGKGRIVAEKRNFEEPPKNRDKKPPEPRKRRTPKPKRRGNALSFGLIGLISLIWRMIWGSIWRLGLTLVLIVAAATLYYYSTLPEPSALFDGRARGSVTMQDREGHVFAWRGETFGMVASDKIAPVLKDAVVATEDKRFYRHVGVDPQGVASAIKINLAAGRGPLEGNGGSTITQQVAKLLCLGETFDPIKWDSEADYEAECRKSSLWRKVKEVPYALAMEAKYSKQDILNIYMNRSYLGAGARGFEAASQRYFDKSAADVTAPEAAMLAGLLKAPSYFAPTSSLQRAQDRGTVILGLMHDQGYLDDAAFAAAKTSPAVLSKAAAARAGGYFADWVMESGPGFLTSETTEDVTITTTFDQRIQRAAERAMKRIFDEKVADGSKAQAAVVIMSPDGAVRAMIGGRDNTATGTFNRATQAQRQTGSSFKPFVFAAALDQGYGPNDLVLDAPLTINVRGSGPWSPQNYSRRYSGEVTLTSALARSLNTATIRLQESAGRDAVRRVAQDFGFANNLASGPALGLGASESTLLAMTGAYAGIRNGGTAVRPYGLVELRIKGDDQPLIGQSGGMGQRVISQKAAGELIGMMERVIEGGTGTRAKLPGRPAAGKTGTTSSYKDAWFIGFTGQYVAGVWMGYDDNTPLKGVTGGGLPAEIWQAVMAEIHEGLPVEPLGTFAFDGSSAVPQVVSSPADDGSVDPLAAALSEALGQPAPSNPSSNNLVGTDGTLATQDGGGQRVPEPDSAISPPTFPAETLSSGAIETTPATETFDDEVPADDPLMQALRGIDGVY